MVEKKQRKNANRAFGGLLVQSECYVKGMKRR